MKKSSQAYRNIREASAELGLEAHVLRFWESRFDDLNPMTRGGGRRFYSVDDLKLLRTIKHLLHEEGYTIKAANRMVSEGYEGPAHIEKPTTDLSSLTTALNTLIDNARRDIAQMNALLNYSACVPDFMSV